MTAATLRRLVEMTVLPPEDGDVDALLDAFTTMFEARRRIIEESSDPVEDTPDARALVNELAVRDAAWASALARALEAVGAIRRNASRLRSYAR